MSRYIRQFLEDKLIAHVAEVEHEVLGEIGVEVDGDPRAAVRVVIRQDRIGIFCLQLENAVGITFKRDKMPSCVGFFRFGLRRELAGELPAAYLVDHPAPPLVEGLGCAGI